jgi:uncharacterized protein YjiS (DUF1127 family)
MDRSKARTQAGRAVLLVPMAQVLTQFGEWRRRQQLRKAYRHTPEALMRDIGLTLDDLMAAMDQPLTEDASDALVKAAAERAGNW